MGTLSWAFNFVPWWSWFVVAGVILLATIPYWSPIWAMTPNWLKTVIAAVAGLLAAYFAGRNRGAKDERDKSAAASARAVQRREETHNDIEKLPDADVTARLGKSGWLRDGD